MEGVHEETLTQVFSKSQYLYKRSESITITGKLDFDREAFSWITSLVGVDYSLGPAN